MDLNVIWKKCTCFYCSVCHRFRMQECCHFISQAKWIQATYLENQHGVCSVFKSQQLFLYGAGCFKVSTLNFNSRFKFSIMCLSFSHHRKFQSTKVEKMRMPGTFVEVMSHCVCGNTRYHFYQSIFSDCFLRSVIVSYNLLIGWHMAPASCLSCWSKGSLGIYL